MKLSLTITLVVTLVLMAAVPAAAQPVNTGSIVAAPNAQDPSVTFPETGYTVDGEFLQFWRINGGLPVFGYPISAEREENGRASQWFERNRFELNPQNAAPYQVLLGRLGAEVLERQGVDWNTLPKADPNTPNFFPETEQAIAAEFWDYWRSHGLDLGDDGISMRESLALFGYPISPARMETNSSGDNVLTQWFERARFEYHPNNPQSYRVLLGRLGAELLAGGTPGTPPESLRQVNPADIGAPDGYQVSVAATGLTYATGIAFDDQGRGYVSEAGGHTYGTRPSAAPPARILRMTATGGTEVVYDNNVPLDAIRNNECDSMPEGLIGPITGLTWNNGLLYVAHRTRVSTLNPQTGEFRTIINCLPAWGEFQNNKVVFGPDGKMYFFVSTQGNSGPVGEGMLVVLTSYNKPDKREIPCEDVALTGENFVLEDPFTDDPFDSKLTGVYVPYGEETSEGQVIKGQVPCNGAFLRANPDGSGMEVFAWGLRSDFGYNFSPDGRLISSQNSGNPIAPREIYNDWEQIYEVQQGKWYGWPDYYSGLAVVNPRFFQPAEPVDTQYEAQVFTLNRETRERLLQGAPLPPQPLVRLEPHVAAQGFAFAQPFGFDDDEILLAEFGTVVTYLRQELPGFRVQRVDLETGQVVDFLVNKSKQPASATGGGGLERPIQLEYGPDGALYVVDFGVINITATGLDARPNTGVIWKVTRAPGAGDPADEVVDRITIEEALEDVDHSDLYAQRQQSLQELSELSGAEFEIGWINRMIPHHEGAIQLGRVGAFKAPHAPVREQATFEIKGQSEQIDKLSTWLRDWYGIAPEPVGPFGISDDLLDPLRGASPESAELQFLLMQRAHHQSAIELAKMLLGRTDLPHYKEMSKLADQILASQQSGQELLASWARDYYNVDASEVALGDIPLAQRFAQAVKQ